MKQRILVAVVGIPALLAVLCVAPAWATALLLAALSVIAAHELLTAVSGPDKARRWTVLPALCAVLLLGRQVFSWPGLEWLLLAAALTLSLCVISALPGGQPRMDAMTYNIDTLPARDLRPVVDGPETEADYTPPAQAIHTAAQEEATAEVSAEAPAPEAPAREKTESAAPAQPAQPASSTSVLAVGVTADSVRLRAAANTGSAILAELNRGTAVSVLGRQDGWYKVNYDGKTGYMSADYVTARSSAGDLRCVARVISDGLNLRSGAAASGAVLATVSRGEYVDVSGFENGWFRVQYSGKTGYMSGDHLTLAAARPAAPAPAPAAPASGTGAEIAALARSFVGKAPYVYGGAGPSGFDCSGFTMYIYGQFGIRLGMDRIKELLFVLGHQENQIRTIHVAGTNGKGSVSSLITDILRHAGQDLQRKPFFQNKARRQIQRLRAAHGEIIHRSMHRQ